MLTNRWSVLALLFLVRLGLGFQFQAVPALAPSLMAELSLTVADIGLLIGLYNAPGIFLALPGGAIGQRFGDKRVVLLGFALMIAGGLVMALFPSWPMQIAGRLIAGVGGILLNVLMTKMAADWFAGKEIATAMGIFVNSWPAGIGLALVTLPAIGEWGGYRAASLAVVVMLAVAAVALAVLYRSPADAKKADPETSMWPDGRALTPILTAGLIWGLYNAGIGTIIGFGPLMLTERGFSSVSASSMTSVIIWTVALSLPLGGFLADRTGRGGVILLVSLVGLTLALFLATRVDWVLPAFILLGFVGALPAGPIMGLPARLLAPETRAVGMGLFYTTTYIMHFLSPWIIGHGAKALGNVRVTFDLAAIAVLAGCLVLLAFWRMTAGATAKAASSP